MSADTYTVVTRLILEEAGMRGKLTAITAALRETEVAFKAVKDASRALFPTAMVDRASRFSDTMRLAREQVTYFGHAAGNTSGPSKLTAELRAANEQARALIATMQRMHTTGMGGPGGRGPGAGGPGGHRGGIFGHGALQTFYDAQLGAQLVGDFFRPGIDFSHQSYAATQQGVSPAELARMQSAAFNVARAVPAMAPSELMQMQRELIPLAQMGLKPGENAVDKMLSHLGDAAQIDTLLGTFMGEKAGTHGQRASEYWNLLRMGESLGLSGGGLQDFTHNAARSIIASGGRINAENLRQVVQKAGAMAIPMDPDVLLKMIPELILEQGGPAVGTMLATLGRSGVGRMTQQALKEQLRLGLVDPSKAHIGPGGKVIMDPGAFYNEEERYRNPAAYAIHTMAPALLKDMGINTAGMTPEQIANRISAGSLSQTEKVKLISDLNRAFSDRNAARGAEQFLLQANQIQRFMEQYNKATLGTFDKARSKDATAALSSFSGAWKGLETVLTEGTLRNSLPIINSLADTMTYISASMARHPGRTAGIVGSGIGVAGVAGAYYGWQLITAGAALKGSAAALATSAASLDAAALKLAGGSLGGLPGTLVKGAGATWLARALPWLSRGLGLGVGLGVYFGGAATGGNEIQPENDQPYFRKLFKKNASDAQGWVRHDGTTEQWSGREYPSLRSVSLDGHVTLTGDVHINAGALGELVGKLVAQGLAHASTGSVSPATGARPDFSGGALVPFGM